MGGHSLGKRTFLRKFTENLHYNESIGFSFLHSTYKSYEVYCWDISPSNMHCRYRRFFVGVKGILFVFEARHSGDDHCWSVVAAQELERLLKEKTLRGVPLIVFANMKNMVNCMTIEEVVEILKLNSFKGLNWSIYSGNDESGPGIEIGFEYFDSI